MTLFDAHSMRYSLIDFASALIQMAPLS